MKHWILSLPTLLYAGVMIAQPVYIPPDCCQLIPAGKLSEGAYVVQIDGYAAQRVLLINPAR